GARARSRATSEIGEGEARGKRAQRESYSAAAGRWVGDPDDWLQPHSGELEEGHGSLLGHQQEEAGRRLASQRRGEAEGRGTSQEA
nr:hypothetical protein [Tanacetum cinerariifolium]